MASDPDGAPADPAIFELDRFAWEGPDRLRVAGRFGGGGALPSAAPVLVLRDGARAHRLTVASDSEVAAGDDGGWAATFAWHEPPAPFAVAELQLGPGLVVELPEPRPGRVAAVERVLPVRGAEAPSKPAAGAPIDVLPLQAEVLATQEEIRELRAELQNARDDAARARHDLEAERERHTADATRFREGLATVQTTAEEAVAAEHSAAEQEVAAMRERVAVLEQTAADADGLRAELEAARGELEAARGDLAAARGELEASRAELGELHGVAAGAHGELQRLLDRLAAARDPRAGDR